MHKRYQWGYAIRNGDGLFSTREPGEKKRKVKALLQCDQEAGPKGGQGEQKSNYSGELRSSLSNLVHSGRKEGESNGGPVKGGNEINGKNRTKGQTAWVQFVGGA